MDGRRDVGDVGRRRPRHVAGDAAILGALGQPGQGWQCASLVGVAFQATAPEIGVLRLGGGLVVRVVTGDAAEGAVAGPVAEALVHLLDVAGVAVLRGQPRPDEHRLEPRQRQTGSVVLQVAAVPLDPLLAQQVALFADVVAQQRRQVARVDDARPGPGDVQRLADVQLAGAVAALAADRMPPEDRRLVAVLRPRHVRDPVGVAIQALGGDRPLEPVGLLGIARREAPVPLLRVPGDRRLEQEAAPRGQERLAALPEPTTYRTSSSIAPTTWPCSSRWDSRWNVRPSRRTSE